MRPLMEPLFNLGFGTEIIYSFVIIACSLMIYFGTKEIYELSSYKGIGYFRKAFLFFAIALFFRSFIKFIVMYFNVGGILEIPPAIFGMVFGQLTLFIFMYFSSMSIFYLLYSVMWKKWNGSNKIFLFHILAFIIALLSVISRNILFIFWINLLLLGLIIFTVYIVYKESKKKKNKLYVIYMLLFIFFLLNVIDVLIPRFLEMFQLFIYLVSIGVFLLILYKVLRKIGN